MVSLHFKSFFKALDPDPEDPSIRIRKTERKKMIHQNLVDINGKVGR